MLALQTVDARDRHIEQNGEGPRLVARQIHNVMRIDPECPSGQAERQQGAVAIQSTAALRIQREVANLSQRALQLIDVVVGALDPERTNAGHCECGREYATQGLRAQPRAAISGFGGRQRPLQTATVEQPAHERGPTTPSFSSDTR